MKCQFKSNSLQQIKHDPRRIHPIAETKRCLLAVTFFLLINDHPQIDARDAKSCDRTKLNSSKQAIEACGQAEATPDNVLRQSPNLPTKAASTIAADVEPYDSFESGHNHSLQLSSELVVEVYPSAQTLRIIYTALEIPPPPGGDAGGGQEWGECGMTFAVDGQDVLGSQLR